MLTLHDASFEAIQASPKYGPQDAETGDLLALVTNLQPNANAMDAANVCQRDSFRTIPFHFGYTYPFAFPKFCFGKGRFYITGVWAVAVGFTSGGPLLG